MVLRFYLRFESVVNIRIVESKHFKIWISILTTILHFISWFLKFSLPEAGFINASQAGFIPGRSIADNILLASELIKGYSSKHISPRCMLKIDLRKAYDSLEWPFLKTMLQELGFPSKFVGWIMKCLNTVSYSILLNGYPSAPIQAKKGLRQGDPMSPFLFALGREYLWRCLQCDTSNPVLNFHPRCKKLNITHMMFADDLLMFSRADSNSVKIIFDAFSKFLEASGLAANLDKSSVYMAGVTNDEEQIIRVGLGMVKGSFPFKYLGVPLTTGNWDTLTAGLLLIKL